MEKEWKEGMSIGYVAGRRENGRMGHAIKMVVRRKNKGWGGGCRRKRGRKERGKHKIAEKRKFGGVPREGQGKQDATTPLELGGQ